MKVRVRWKDVSEAMRTCVGFHINPNQFIELEAEPIEEPKVCEHGIKLVTFAPCNKCQTNHKPTPLNLCSTATGHEFAKQNGIECDCGKFNSEKGERQLKRLHNYQEAFSDWKWGRDLNEEFDNIYAILRGRK